MLCLPDAFACLVGWVVVWLPTAFGFPLGGEMTLICLRDYIHDKGTGRYCHMVHWRRWRGRMGSVPFDLGLGYDWLGLHGPLSSSPVWSCFALCTNGGLNPSFGETIGAIIGCTGYALLARATSHQSTYIYIAVEPFT